MTRYERHLLDGDEPNLTEIAKTINLGDEHDSELMENGENHKIETITDELREYAQDWRETPNLMDELDAGDIDGLLGDIEHIADRIDAQLKRICKQHESVLQSTIEDNVDYDDLYAAAASFAGCDECGEYKQCMHQEFEKRVAVEQERDELRAELEELRGHSLTCPKSDEEMSESAPFASITDELRAYSRESVKRDDYMGGLAFDLDRIADRIDEQFRRICEQHERVLQSTIDEMGDELDDLMANSGEMANNGELAAKCEALMAANADLAKGIDDARESEYRAERQRDELKASLDESKELLKISYGKQHAYKLHIEHMQVGIKRLREKCDKLQARLDKYDRTHAELPKDEDVRDGIDEIIRQYSLGNITMTEAANMIVEAVRNG